MEHIENTIIHHAESTDRCHQSATDNVLLLTVKRDLRERPIEAAPDVWKTKAATVTTKRQTEVRHEGDAKVGGILECVEDAMMLI